MSSTFFPKFAFSFNLAYFTLALSRAPWAASRKFVRTPILILETTNKGFVDDHFIPPPMPSLDGHVQS